MSVETIARKIIDRTRSKSPLQFRPLPQDDPRRRKPVIEAAEKRLGWRPRVALDDGLEATIAYFSLLLAGRAPVEAAGRTARSSSARAAPRLTLASQR
jgi:UDP-glucuronate decarboxylase